MLLKMYFMGGLTVNEKVLVDIPRISILDGLINIANVCVGLTATSVDKIFIMQQILASQVYGKTPLQNMFKKCFKVHNFPILTAIWFTTAYILTYVAAVLEGHVSPLFPYISWTGMLPPESCIFSFMLNVGSALMFIVIFIRYKLLKLISNFRMPKHLNVCTFYLGVTSCLGINLVANFQESNVLTVHMIGAFSAFGFATLYCCLQVWITWKIDGSSKFLIIFRTVLCVLMVPAFVDMFLFGNLAERQFNGTQSLQWKDEDGGYNFHLASTFSEWIIALAINIFVFTFETEFKRIRFEGVVFSKKY